MCVETSDNQVPRTRRRFGRRARWLLVLLAVAAGFLLAELGIRLFRLAPAHQPIVLGDPDSVYQKSDNPRLGFEMKPSYRAENADSYLHYPRTNAHGQRDVERTIEKPAGRRRAILLGDSVVEGYGLREIDETISRQMELGPLADEWEVLNFGVSGYCTLAEVELLRTKGLRFDPDVVLLVFVQNDFENFNQDNAQVAEQGGRSPLVRSLFVNSHLFRLASLRLNLLAPPGSSVAISDNNVVEGLYEFAQLAAEHGFQPGIAVWPQFDDERIFDLHAMPDDESTLIVERVAAMHGIPLIRLAEAFQEHRRAHPEITSPKGHYTIGSDGDGMHPNVAAAGIAAQALARFVRELWSKSQQGERSFVPEQESDDAAVAAAAAVSKGMPANAQSFANMANVYLNIGQPERAAKFFEQALVAEPENADIHTRYGRVLFQLERTEEARAHLQRAVEMAPRHAMALTNLGVFLIAHDEPSAAEVHLRRLVEVQPSHADTHFHLARALGNQEDDPQKMAEASEHYRKAIELQPSRIEAHFHLARLQESLQQVDEAIETLAEAVRLNGAQGELRAYLASLLQRRGRFHEAAAHYRVLVEAEPDEAEWANNLAWILATATDASLRDGQTALELAERAEKLTEGEDPAVLDTLAAAYAEVGRFAEALATVERALQLVEAESELAATLRQHRTRFAAGQPYREAATPP
ncbi:MAG: hypothetical protein DWQ42_07075 [Planctomycetota bacterium]|nr:MAG: hypothetical protein DWQ42_07075 [Planctomycetota bacterium]REK38440.1 MAG: hypothetical protein DWQ46_20110 [Planctomycetota bacterium]